MKSIKFRKSRIKSYVLALAILFVLPFHQNCSQPGAISVNTEPSQSSSGGLSDSTGSTGGGGNGNTSPGAPGYDIPLDPVMEDPHLKTYSTETFANTELNKPVEFKLEPVKVDQLTGVKITDQKFVVMNGTLELLDAVAFKFKYTPEVNYRGSDYSVVNGVDDKGHKITFNVKIAIDNPVQNLKPALAIRGMGCIQCHANVDSNIVTDFGFGDSYYFGADAWKNGGIYGDHGQNFNTMDLKATLQILVPQVETPSQVKKSTGLATLAAYISKQLSLSSSSNTRAVKVVEKSKVYIGSPNSADIEKAFSMKSTDRIKYFKNGDSSVALSGLSDKSTYFKNDGVLTCEGDVALRGPVYLENLQVNSSTGCRLHVIGSVFVYGSISHMSVSDNRNLQIASTKSISMGLGLTKKDNKYCEPGSRYATDPGSYNVSSLKARYVTFWTVPNSLTRGVANAQTNGASILSEADLIEKGEGTLLWDASCRPEGRNVGFERLLLNAPIIQSRYEGNVTGTIIAEYALMSLGEFKFKYDQVFDRTPILPLLKHETYLDIQ